MALYQFVVIHSSSVRFWHRRGDKRLGTPPQGNQDPQVVKDNVWRPQDGDG